MWEDTETPDEPQGDVENATTADSPIPPEAEAPAADPPAQEAAAPDSGASMSAAAPAKADLGKRIVAAIIDLAIAFVVGFVPGVGQLLGAAYMILRDGLELDFMNHRSIGKHVMKLHVVSVEGEPLELMTSVKRNIIFAIGPLIPLLFLIPVIGWIMIPFVTFAAIALFLTELVLAITDGDGRRLGDKFGGTMVVED